jgi:hypothetical protein
MTDGAPCARCYPQVVLRWDYRVENLRGLLIAPIGNEAKPFRVYDSLFLSSFAVLAGLFVQKERSSE